MTRWLPLMLALSLPLGSLAQEAPDEAADELPVTTLPTLLAPVLAAYPEARRAAGEQAEVTLLVELDELGAVTHVEVMTGAGEDFDQAAIAALRSARFSPALTAEGPVGVAFPFTYRFTLPSEGASAPGAAEDAEAPTAEPAPVGDDLPIVEGPAIAEYVEAPYPAEAQAAGITGEVGLLITLTAEGLIEAVEVSRPAGNGFDEAALEAVRQMKFTPARTAEGPIGVVFEFSYAFTLQAEAPADDLPPPVNLDGRIRQMGTRRPVEGATVVVVGQDLTAVTDADGRFELRGAATGLIKVKVLHPEHIALEKEVEVVEGELTSAELWIRSLTYRENEAVGYYEREREEVTRRTLAIDEIKRIPGTFGDPVKVIQTLPGAARSPFGTGLLIIRGANPEDTAVYVDGVRIPIVYHLTGTTSVLSPEVVEAVDYLPGGYGVQFGRSMAGTVNVRTKEKFDDSKLIWGTDLLDSQLWYEGNLGKKKQHGFAIGARRSYIDLFIPLLTANTGFTVRPVYWDYQVKWIPQMGEGEHFSVFLYGFQDILRVSTPPDVAQGTDVNTQGDLKTTYQSHRIVARWRKEFSDRLSFELQPSIGVDLNNIGLGQDFGLDNWNVIAQLRSEVVWRPHDAIEIVPGIDFIGGPWDFAFRSALSFEDLGDPLAERDPVAFDGNGTAWSPDAYLKLNLRPLKDRERWLITPGVRLTQVAYVYGGGVTFGEDVAPAYIPALDARLATRAKVFEIGEQTGTIKASSGLYHQAPQPFESIGLGVSVDLLAERAWNSSLGFEHRISPAVSWDLDVFYRRMDRLVEFNDSFVGRGSQPFANSGEGYAAGFELILRHAKTGPFFGWISYTFSRSFRRSDPGDAWTPFDFDQPHIFSAQGGYSLPFDIGISAQLQVVSGNPDSSFNAGVYDVDSDTYNGFRVGDYNGERLPTFVQTSFRIDRTFTFRTWQLDLYLDLINAIRGVNPETTVYNYDYSESAYVRGLPFIPNLGIELRFYP
jgi:TonB family protein